MPHVTLEYSANLDGRVDVNALCGALLRSVLSSGLFEVGAPRVRAVRCENYAIADADAKNAFVDIVMRMGGGRSADDRKRLGEAMFAGAQSALAELFDTQYFALSLEIREIEAEMSWKRNTMHQRLRGK